MGSAFHDKFSITSEIKACPKKTNFMLDVENQIFDFTIKFIKKTGIKTLILLCLRSYPTKASEFVQPVYIIW